MNSVQVAEKQPSVGTKCVISGWGDEMWGNEKGVNYLRFTNVKILDPNKCNQNYRGGILRGMLCAGSWEGMQDACKANIIDSFSHKLCDGKFISPH